MPRRLFWLFLAAFLMVAVIAAAIAAVAYRAPLLGFALEYYLAHEGFPDARLEVTEFSRERIAVTGVSLGEGAPSAARVAADSYLNLLRNDVDRFRLTVESPRVAVDLTQTGGPGFDQRLAQIESLLESYRDFLPILELRDAVVSVRGESGRALTLAADVITRVDWPSFGFSVKGRATGAGAQATFDFRSGGSAEMPGMRLDANGEADLAALPWPAGLTAPTAGTASFQVESLLPLPTLIESFDDAFARFDGTGKLDLKLAGVAVPDRAKDAAAALTLEGEGNPQQVALRLTNPAELAAAGLILPELESLGPVGAALAGQLAPGAKATLSPDTPEKPVIVLARTSEGWQGSIGARMKLTAGKASADVALSGNVTADETFRPQELAAAAVELNGAQIPLGFAVLKSLAWKAKGTAAGGTFEMAGPLAFRLAGLTGLEGNDLSYAGAVTANMDAQALTIESQKPGTLTIGDGAVHIGALNLDALKAQVTAVRIRRDANGLAVKIAAKPDAISGTLTRESGPLSFTAKAGALTLEAAASERITGTIGLEKASLDLPDAQIAVADATLTLPFAAGGDAEPGRLAATIESTAEPALFDPIVAAIALTWKKEALEAAGDMTLAQGKVQMPLAAHYAFAGGGALRMGPADIAFAPGKLQPSGLNPALKQIRKAEGTVRYDGTFAYSPDGGLTSRGQVGFENLTLETAEAKIETLNGTLDFTDLIHLRTAPDQILSAARVSAGAAVEGVEVDFSMAAGPGGAVVEIDEAHAHIADGDLDVPDTTLRFADASNAATIHVKSVSLSRLMEHLGTDAVGGTGLFSGVIPVRFGAAGLAIDDAELKAESGGVLNVRLGSAKETLEAQGEAMRLMVKALENFHYTVFDIAVSRPPGENLSLKIKLEGNNPEVLDGHPFRFNINLTTDIGPLLEALRAGRGLTADILEKAVDVKR